MKRRTKAQKRNSLALSQVALKNLRESNLHPGFDYEATLRELNEIYSLEELAEFCSYGGKSGIWNVINDDATPSHPIGELIYILYVNTFNPSEELKIVRNVLSRKPPNKSLEE
jgi:hypothetical protein